MAKLPTAPLVDKALEGAAKGSDGAKIVVRRSPTVRADGLGQARLGSSADPEEIKAAADALDAGVSARDLARLQAASGKRPLTMPLAVLSDLIGRTFRWQRRPISSSNWRVPALKDAELALFQRNVRADIDHGADPTVAATTRARGLVLSVDGIGDKPAE